MSEMREINPHRRGHILASCRAPTGSLDYDPRLPHEQKGQAPIKTLQFGTGTNP
jgi:hypothetical protein